MDAFIILKALIDLNISHAEFVLTNVLKEFYDMKQEIKNSSDESTRYKALLSFCLKCRENTESKNPLRTKELKTFLRTKNGRIMFSSKCKVCDNKKSKFI